MAKLYVNEKRRLHCASSVAHEKLLDKDISFISLKFGGGLNIYYITLSM
jgi:hypothetical protein